MQFEECLAEACGERRRRLCDAALCTCKLCCEAGQEVILGLLGSQDGNRRKNAERICGKEDDVLGIRSCGLAVNLLDDLFNVIDRVRYTGVLGYALVSEIKLAVIVNRYVLKKSVSPDCAVNIRLCLCVKVNNLRVAAAFVVEDAIVVPAVLVIADQQPDRPKKIDVCLPS